MQAVTAHPLDDTAGMLVVYVQVICDQCGDIQLVVPGHHIKPLMQLLQEVIDKADPALIDSGEQTTVERSTHHLTDPRNN